MKVQWPNSRYDREKQRMVEEPADRSYHLIGDYFRLPHDPSASAFTEVIGVFDMAIGFYEDLERRAKADLWNPLAWIAHALYAPVWVMARAALVDPEEPKSPVLQGYTWLLRAVLLIALALLLKKLGLGALIGTIIK